MSTQTWAEVLTVLKSALGANNFSNWIEPLELTEIADGVAVFAVPTNFIGNYVSQNFGDQIIHQFNKKGAVVQRLQFHVPRKGKAAPAAKPAPDPGGQPWGGHSTGVDGQERP